MARTIRKEFGFGNPAKPLSFDRLCGLKGGSHPLVQVGSKQQFDGVARLAARFGPQVATAKNRESSQGYIMARALGEYLCSAAEKSALLTRASSDRQKRNRAFAAELLAPAEGLRELLSGSRIARDEAADVAACMGVSEWLVEHQIQNHHIATIEATVPLPAGK